ncbi:MAG: hypothetical protein LBK95_17240 [Bifidobacteriaceae bacterium]|jgi:antitoxin (DNA-binding transcriptional repressor) of toxin-antitoxin stability system|nr:hypothetical protein [Bifidobacteriaceae bacterium]
MSATETVTSTNLIHATRAVMGLVIDQGKTIDVTYHGVPRARIAPVTSSRHGMASNPVAGAIEQGRAAAPRCLSLPRHGPLVGESGLTVDELLAETRAERA